MPINPVKFFAVSDRIQRETKVTRDQADARTVEAMLNDPTAFGLSDDEAIKLTRLLKGPQQ